MDIPDDLLVHTVDVATKLGDGAFGESFGTPAPVPCFREGGRRMVRQPNGDEALASWTLYCRPGLAATFTPGSKVTWDGNATVVLAAIEHDDGGMGAPQHTEVSLQ